MAQSNSAAAYTFTTFAGKPVIGSADGVGSAAQFNHPFGVAVDSGGNVYVADTDNHTIRKITSAGVVSTIAGFPGNAGSTDGIGSNARFNRPFGVAVNSANNLFVTDGGNFTIRMLTPVGSNWMVTTIAGLALNSGSTDGTSSSARFTYPDGIAVDNESNVYVLHFDPTVRRVTLVGTNWVVTTIAGLPGNPGSSDGTNSSAQFHYSPSGIAVDITGNLYVADTENHTIRKITRSGTNWVVSTVAGLAENPGSVDGVGSGARFSYPNGVAVDRDGNVFVTDANNQIVRKVNPAAVVSTLAGLAGNPGTTDGTGTNARFGRLTGVALDGAGSLYVTDAFNNTVRKISSAGVVRTFAGSTTRGGSVDDTGIAARFNFPQGIAVDGVGNLYVADTYNQTIRQVSSAGVVSTMAGLATNSGAADGIGNDARFSYPEGVAVDTFGNVYVADTYNHKVRMITQAGVVSTIAGSGVPGGTDGTNGSARFYYPSGIAVDRSTNVYVADTRNNMIRLITPIGTNWLVSTISGNGFIGIADGTNRVARFHDPFGITVDTTGILYVTDSGYSTIRRIAPVGTNWVVTTIAGLPFNPGTADGTGSVARFNGPQGIAVDVAGHLYVSDADNHTIRRIALVGTNWVVNTIGGLPSLVGNAIDGAGSVARFNYPCGITVDGEGNLYVADGENNTIRKGVFTEYAPRNAMAYTPPAIDGQLTVTLLPPEANGQWRFPWELGWRNSDTTASNLVAGNYTVEFRNLPGYLAPPELVTVSGVTHVTNEYLPTFNDASPGGRGALTVSMGLNPPTEARWRFPGETDADWRTPGSTVAGLLPGTYFIEFRPVDLYSKPANRAVQVDAGVTTAISENYLFAQQPLTGVLLPFAVPSAQVSNLNTYPFGFNGQLVSDVGSGSGVAVQQNVVLTAAHLVFNDETLSYVSRAHWFFQKEAGEFSPLPQRARSIYVLSGYASQRAFDRTNGFGPGQSTPQSRNLDVAALYFQSPVAGGGHGGYLPSDTVPNSWLSGNSLKMVVGYPVDGSVFGDATIVPGRMYQTDPQPYALNPATDPIADQQVYVAPWFLSYPGNSGGPLYVQFNGYYYPAGVYLGTLYNGAQPYASLVRAIDTNVVRIITLATALGETGTNHDGGVIRFIPDQTISASNPGYLQFILEPPAAYAAGARWRVQGSADYSTAPNFTLDVITTNPITVEFKTNVPGWIAPASREITVRPLQTTRPTVYYTVTNPVMVINRAVGIGITGTTGTTYQLQTRNSLTTGEWAGVSTFTILTNGFNLVLPKPATNPPNSFYRARWIPE